ncbi:hypothetical protein BO71DRAFT_390984 [Aspergillus ellipticus CBS 707.79]|uniref:Uncharacterized protein n=1 Tax=Aspergillus ellipticus CBS 707.79 TaxID=1448320 RepID=A0A319CVE2_9EURO|nr:hypothetical protein BO71DRAFT_390984 [Aspergillus ellipticus CBS 707.79]
MEDTNQDHETQRSLLASKGPVGHSTEAITSGPRKKTPSFGRDIQPWLWELCCVILSGGVLAAMAIILAKYDGHAQPNWRNVSLNSVISWLSTLAKAGILYAVSESLGQLKWIWFSQRRPLSDLGCFDSASRGVTGSVLLAWLLRGRHFAVFGSMAIIMALAFDPFVQNLIHYVPRLVKDNSQTSLIGKAVTYTPIVELFNASVSLGAYQEKQLAKWTTDNSSGYLDAIITPDSLNQTFNLSREVWDATDVFINDLFAGRVQAASDIFTFSASSASAGMYATADAIEAIYYGNFTAAGCTADDPLTCAIDNVAAAMTKTLRDNAFTNKVGYDGEEVVHSEPVVGHTLATASFVEIRWQWLALPVAVWLLGAVSCVGTAWKSYAAQTRAWMTSALPLVMLEKRWQDREVHAEDEVEMTGLRAGVADHDPENNVDEGEDLSLEQYEKGAKQVYAKLEIGKGRIALAR